MVSNGATVEREIESQVLKSGELELILRSPDSSTAVKIADAVNQYYPGTSLAKDGGLVNIRVPANFQGQTTNFLAAIGGIDAKPDAPARVIINERTGTIVATQSVRISPVAVSSSNITIFLNPTTGVSQPLPFPPEQRLFWRVKTPSSLKKSVGSKLWMSWTPEPRP